METTAPPTVFARSESPARYKRLTWFFVGAVSLLGAGCLLTRHFNYVELLVLMWCTLGGTFLIYRINDYIDTEHGFRFNILAFLLEKRHMIIAAHLFFIAFPVAYFTITPFCFMVLAAVAALGVFYSISFSLGSYRFRLKNVFLLKNISIGLAWGSLVLVGAGSIASPDVLVVFLFASIQVTVGSMIRDIPDREKDRDAGARTYPVLFGDAATLRFLFIANIASVLLIFIPELSVPLMVTIGVTVAWRTIILWKLRNNYDNRLWGQTLNLFTCTVIFLMVFFKFLLDGNQHS